MANYPVFNAHRTNPVDFSIATSVSYDLVTINQGDGLNGSSGVFVAPISGVYHFSYMDTTLASSVYTAVKMFKNSEVVAAGYVESSIRPWIVAPIFATATLRLEPGDQVSVRQFGQSGNSGIVPPANNGIRMGKTLTFSGFLIHSII